MGNGGHLRSDDESEKQKPDRRCNEEEVQIVHGHGSQRSWVAAALAIRSKPYIDGKRAGHGRQPSPGCHRSFGAVPGTSINLPKSEWRGSLLSVPRRAARDHLALARC